MSSLPSSPPWTESNIGPTPPTSAQQLSTFTPLDSPPTSPKQALNPTSPASSALSPTPPATIPPTPLAPLPAEACFTVVSFLPQPERARLGLVSRAWHAFLAAEPRLWPELKVDLHHDQDDHVELWTQRAGIGQDVAGAGVRSLKLTLATQQVGRAVYGDIVSTGVMAHRLSRVFRLLDQGPKGAGTGASLDQLDVLSQPNTHTTLKLLTAVGSYAGHSFARRLKVVRVNGWVAGVWVNRGILSVWPEIEELDLTFYDEEKYPGISPVPRTWQFGVPPPGMPRQLALEKLETIRWHALTVPHSLDLPLLPGLTRLVLHDVSWEGYSLLLLIRMARRSLEEVEIVNLRLFDPDPAFLMDDYDQNVLVADPDLIDDYKAPIPDIDDDDNDEDDDSLESWNTPPPIILPRLRRLTVAGQLTGPVFGTLEVVDAGDELSQYPTGVWVMPALEECTLHELDLDSSNLFDQNIAPLKLFGQNTTQLKRLSLFGCACTPLDIYNALQPSATELAYLSLANTGATDQLLAHLPLLTPRLHKLDVRQCPNISITSVARLVEAIRDRSDGRHRLERVRADWPDWGHAEFAAAEWLLFQGTWVRVEEDFEGLGPEERRANKKWVREGKADAGREEREALWKARQWEERLKRQAGVDREERERLKTEAKASRDMRYGKHWPGTTEVHYRTGVTELGCVRLLDRFEPTEAEVEREAVAAEEDMNEIVGAEQDEVGIHPSPGQHVVALRERPSSAMSLVEQH